MRKPENQQLTSPVTIIGFGGVRGQSTRPSPSSLVLVRQLISWHTCLIHLHSVFSSNLQITLNFQSVRRAALESSPWYWFWGLLQQDWHCVGFDGSGTAEVQSDKMLCFLWVMRLTGCSGLVKAYRVFLLDLMSPRCCSVTFTEKERLS